MGLMAMLEQVLNGQGATATVATPATHKPITRPTVATVASVAVASSPKPKTERGNLRLVHTANERTEQEAALYAERLQSFQGKGIPDNDATALANRLVRRDSQDDDRRSCAECLSFYAGNCRQRITPIGETTIHTLHRCNGFKLNEVNND